MKIVQISAIDSTMDTLLGRLNAISLEEGYEVIGICSVGDRAEKIKTSGVNLINTNIDRSINPISNLKTIIAIYKILKKERPEIVHVHTPIAAVLGRIAARLANVPIIVYTAHGFYFHENMKKSIYRLCFNIEKYMGKFFTDFIFTQSEEDAIVAKRGKFLREDRILQIGNGVDTVGIFNKRNIKEIEVKSIKESLSIQNDEIVISFIGRLVEEKGILDLLEAFKMSDKDKFKLLIIGDLDNGERDLKCKEILKKYKEEKNIYFLGNRRDINLLLHITDIFCLPSYREGMPRSIIEAMAMECAVIATNIRGSREEVVHGETGFLVPLKSSEEIAEKFSILEKDRELLKHMKEQGRKRAEQLYDEKKVVYKQLKIFGNLLKEKGLDDSLRENERKNNVYGRGNR